MSWAQWSLIRIRVRKIWKRKEQLEGIISVKYLTIITETYSKANKSRNKQVRIKTYKRKNWKRRKMKKKRAHQLCRELCTVLCVCVCV